MNLILLIVYYFIGALITHWAYAGMKCDRAERLWAYAWFAWIAPAFLMVGILICCVFKPFAWLTAQR